MPLEITRSHLASLSQPGGVQGGSPVHGFVITHPGGAVLVDAGPSRVHFCRHADVVQGS
jgi:hypothetical protein